MEMLAKRYDEMAKHMKTIVTRCNPLTEIELTYLKVAYREAIDTRLQAWRVYNRSVMLWERKGKPHLVKVARTKKVQVEAELTTWCRSILDLVDFILRRNPSDACVIFCWELKAHYYEVISEWSADEGPYAVQLAYEAKTKVRETLQSCINSSDVECVD